MSSASSNASLYAGSALESIPEPDTNLSVYLASTIHDTLSSTKLDCCLALQSQTSGHLHNRNDSLAKLNARAKKEVGQVKRDFIEGAKLAKSLKADLKQLQSRIRVCNDLARQKIPVEWHNARDEVIGTSSEQADES